MCGQGRVPCRFQAVGCPELVSHQVFLQSCAVPILSSLGRSAWLIRLGL